MDYLIDDLADAFMGGLGFDAEPFGGNIVHNDNMVFVLCSS
jgi:hypothetical protein